MKYFPLIRELGTGPVSANAPDWFGLSLSDTEAEILGELLRHSPETIKNHHLPVGRALSPKDAKHASHYHACAECQIEDGGWRWSTGDQLRVACRVHKTVLQNEGPGQEKLAGDRVFANSHEWNWESFVQQPSNASAFLVDLQTELANARYSDKDREIDGRFKHLYGAYRGAIEQTPDAPCLREWCGEGWAILEDLGRQRTDRAQQERAFDSGALYTRVEDLIALYPTAVPALIAAAHGDTDMYDHMLDDIRSVGPGRKIDTSAAAKNAGGVLGGRPVWA